MTRFGDKLRRRFGVPAADDPDPLPEALAARAGPSPVHELLRRREERRRQRRPAVALPAGEDAHNQHGSFFLRTLRYPAATHHGRRPLLGGGEPAVAALGEAAGDEAVAAAAPGDLLFLDTETTGLSGGAGTVVFLCGMAWLEDGAVVLEQAFLRAFAEEAALLHHVEARLRRHPVLVSFVGKTFDRHRLANRMAVHRIDTRMLRAAHLDLYHLARRRFRGRLHNTRLRTVEEEVLGLVRDDDLPGAFAPLAWLDWLRDGSGPVDRVFEHNRLDVLSLVRLAGELGEATAPDGAGGGAAG